jgi:hypothetical protein
VARNVLIPSAAARRAASVLPPVMAAICAYGSPAR